MRLFLLLSLLLAMPMRPVLAEPLSQHDVFISSNRDGIWHTRLDGETGSVAQPRRIVDSGDNRFLALGTGGQCLYGASGQGETSVLTGYHLIPGGLQAASEVVGPYVGATHISVSPDGNYLATAYYWGGGVSIHALAEDCRIGEAVLATPHEGSSIHPERQQRAFPHWSGFSADSRRAYFTDLGTDEIWVYSLGTSTGAFTLEQKAAAPPGSGPRHLAFSPDRRFAYASDELTARVSIYDHDPDTGQLAWRESLPAAPEAAREAWHNVSHLELDAAGQRLYVMNRGFDRVSVFAVDGESGSLKPVMREPVRGSISRHFAFGPTGRWFVAAGVASNHMATFSVQEDGGLLFARHIVYVPGPNSIVIR